MSSSGTSTLPISVIVITPVELVPTVNVSAIPFALATSMFTSIFQLAFSLDVNVPIT